MTDKTQSGLDDILLEYRGRILTYDEIYRKQHHSSHRRFVDFEYANTVISQAILDLITKARIDVIKALESELEPEGIVMQGNIMTYKCNVEMMLANYKAELKQSLTNKEAEL